MAAAASPKNHENLAEAAVHFLPPAGEGGIRRSPARRMTEEGEPCRLLTAKSTTFLTAACHFHGAVPSGSPSPAALVGGTLPRWWRDRTAADAPDVVPCHGCSCAERASPFSTMGRGTAANAPGVIGFGAAAWGVGTARPTTGWVRIRPTLFGVAAAAARNAGDGVPYRACADSPGVGPCLWQLLRGCRGRHPLRTGGCS